MKIRVISYGIKYYEDQGIAPPSHDFLFNLRDLNNPYWVPELKDFNGRDIQIIEFFEKDPGSQKRLQDVSNLAQDFVEDFLANPVRQKDDLITFAFRCTGGRHRSVYFAEQVGAKLKTKYDARLDIELEHIDLPRYQQSNYHGV